VELRIVLCSYSKIELSADQALGKLDPQHAERILKFLFQRLARLENPGSIGQAPQVTALGIFGSTESAIFGSSAESRMTASSFADFASVTAAKYIDNLRATFAPSRPRALNLR